MKFSTLVLLVSIAFTSSSMTVVAEAASTCDSTSGSAGGAGVHVPVGKDGEGLYTASTKGW